MAKVQVHVIYRGHVQGVGFRFTAEHVASRLGVVGWVKNLEDGSVEIVAEQEEGIIDDFLAQLKNKFSNYIIDEVIEISKATNQFNDFSVTF